MGADRIETINLAIRNQARRDGFEKGVFLSPVIDECEVILGQRLKDIRVEVECDPAISMDCKRSELGQILMNLLSNAADAIRGVDARNASIIRVRVESFLDESGAPFIRLRVSDSGPGIAEELVDKGLGALLYDKGGGCRHRPRNVDCDENSAIPSRKSFDTKLPRAWRCCYCSCSTSAGC